MTPERWQEIKRVFEGAVEYHGEARGRFVAESCAGDEAMRGEVERILAADDAAHDFMERPAVSLSELRGMTKRIL